MSNFLESLLFTNKQTLKNTIEKYSLYSKKIIVNESKFIILYNKHKDNDKERNVFRNLKFIKCHAGNYKLISYNFNNIVDVDKLNELNDDVYEGFEGTTINIFYLYSKWYYTTNKCIDVNQSKFSSDKTHGDMLFETIHKQTLEKFLDLRYNYTFILVHHQNKYYIDYTNRFGKNYKKLLFLWCKDSKMNIVKDMSFENNILLFPNMMMQSHIKNPKFNDYIESFINVSFNENNKEITIKRVMNNEIKLLKEKIPNCNSEVERQIFSYQHNKLTYYLLFRFHSTTYEDINLIKLFQTMFVFVSELTFTVYYSIKNKYDINDEDNPLLKSIYKIKSITEKNKKPYPTKKFIYDYYHFHIKEGILYRIMNYACSKKCFLKYKTTFNFEEYRQSIINFTKLYLE